MRAWGLRILLPLAAVALVAVVATAVFVATWSHAAQLAREEAMARAERVVSRAAEAIAAQAAEAERAARLLAENPALPLYVGAGDTAAAHRVLDRFRAAGGLDGVAVDGGGGWVTVGAIEPSELIDGHRLDVRGDEWQITALAREATPGSAGRWLAAVSRRLALEGGTGPAVRLLTPVEAGRAVGGGHAAALHGALEGASGGGWDDTVGAFAVRPVAAAGGVGGVLVASLSPGESDAPMRRLARRALWIALAVVLVAAIAAAGLATNLARGVAGLSAAAEAIGRGELEQPVPAVGGRELGGLASRLDDMRRRLRGTQLELGHQQSELEAVVSGIAEGVLAVDGERRVRFLSAPAAQLLAVDAAAAVGAFCGDLLRPEPVDGVRPCDGACPILHARFRGQARALESLDLAAGRQSLVVSSAAPTGGVQVVILRHESAVEAARRARDAAVADLAHELHTPIAAQSASLELLRERLAERDEAGLDLVLALEAGTFRLRRLIDNLLESVRIESGQLAIRRVEVDLDEVIEEAVAMTQPLLARRRQSLELELPPVLPALRGDPQRLGQVIVNLLANASKFGPESSTVRLGVAVEASGLELWICDRGPGFAAAPRPGRFRRGLDEPPQAGSGLGLWLCRSILERHGGELRVARQGEETRVSARLPLGDAA